MPAAPPSAAPPAPDDDVDAAARWPAIAAALSGTWVSEDGAWTIEAHPLARGSAVVQTWRAGGGETLNLLHPDGDALVLLHVCAQGNLASLRARPTDDGHLAFVQREVTAMQPGSGSLCAFELWLQPDRVRMVEQYCGTDGTREAPSEIVLRRSASATTISP
ncbi:MAG: hypothetical protein K1X88_23825 [Nannocystaceae bacterium]|nr:hypothetical protein [Nannocystaceae bacterium]